MKHHINTKRLYFFVTDRQRIKALIRKIKSYSVAYLGGGHAAMPPRKVRKHFLTRYTVKNGISNLYILLKSALKMQKMPFQRPKFQNLQFCRHHGLPLTKILATPLVLLEYSPLFQCYPYGWRRSQCFPKCRNVVSSRQSRPRPLARSEDLNVKRDCLKSK